MVARSFLVELAQATGDTIHLGVRDGDHVLYLDKVSGTKGLEMRSRIGSRMRIATTAMGKALMLDATEQEWKRCYELGTGAALKLPPIPATRLSWEEFRDAMRRYATGQCAFDLEENEMSIRCVAAPIRIPHPQCPASLGGRLRRRSATRIDLEGQSRSARARVARVGRGPERARWR